MGFVAGDFVAENVVTGFVVVAVAGNVVVENSKCAVVVSVMEVGGGREGYVVVDGMIDVGMMEIVVGVEIVVAVEIVVVVGGVAGVGCCSWESVHICCGDCTEVCWLLYLHPLLYPSCCCCCCVDIVDGRV